MTTNFPNGATNAAAADTWGRYLADAPTKVHEYFNDFNEYVAGDWTITTTEAGAGSATEALENVDGGSLLITNDDADNDNDFLQKVGEGFKFESTKKLWFECRMKVSDATQSDWVMGLQITDTTPLAVTDGVYFIKADGATAVVLRVIKDSTGTDSATIHTNADATWVKLGFYYNGVDAITPYINGNPGQDLAVTNLPDDEELTVSFGIQNGEAAAKTMSIDYIFVAKER